MNPILTLGLAVAAIYVGYRVIDHPSSPLSPLPPSPGGGALPSTHPAVLNAAANHGSAVANNTLGVDGTINADDPGAVTDDPNDPNYDINSSVRPPDDTGYGGDLAGALADATGDDYDSGNMTESSSTSGDDSSSSLWDDATSWL